MPNFENPFLLAHDDEFNYVFTAISPYRPFWLTCQPWSRIDNSRKTRWNLITKSSVQHNQGLPNHTAMNKHKTTAIRADAAFDVRPAAHRVHRLVLGDFLQHFARRPPCDPLQSKKAHREPKGEEVAECDIQLLQVDCVRLLGVAICNAILKEAYPRLNPKWKRIMR